MQLTFQFCTKLAAIKINSISKNFVYSY